MNTKRFIAMLLAGLMVLSVLAGGAALAGTTTTSSDLSDTETTEEEIADNIIVGFQADGENSTLVQYETTLTTDTMADFETLQLEIEYQNASKHVIGLGDLEDADFDGQTDGTDAAVVDFVVDHDELDTLPGQAGEGTIVDVTVTEVEDADNGVDETTAFVAEIEFDTSHSVVYIDSDEHNSVASVAERSGGLLSSFAFWSDDEDPDVVEIDDDRTVANGTHNSTFYLADEGVDDSFDHVADDEDGFLASATEDTVLGATVLVDGELVPLFDGAAADWYDTSDTYAVLDGDEVTVEYGDDVRPDEGEEAADVTVQMQTENALDSDLNVDRDDLSDLYGDELDTGVLANEFGWYHAFRM